MKDSRAPGTVWMMRRPLTYPNGYVMTGTNDTIIIAYFESENDYQAIVLNRADARLLAKRVSQCLDRTVKS